MLKDYPIEIISFSETKSTHVTPLNVPFQFVTSNSAGTYTMKIILYNIIELLTKILMFIRRSWSR